MHPPHSTIWQLSVYEWSISCVDNSTMYSLDAFTTQYHLTSITHTGIVPLSFKTIWMILNDQSTEGMNVVNFMNVVRTQIINMNAPEIFNISLLISDASVIVSALTGTVKELLSAQLNVPAEKMMIGGWGRAMPAPSDSVRHFILK